MDPGSASSVGRDAGVLHRRRELGAEQIGQPVLGQVGVAPLEHQPVAVPRVIGIVGVAAQLLEHPPGLVIDLGAAPGGYPANVAGLSGITRVACGGYSTLALKSDGTVWQLGEVTIATDAYTADQTLEAWYAGLDFSFGDWLRLGGGLRSERSDQSVVTFDIFNEGGDPVVSELSTRDEFWSFSTTLVFGDHQVRAGYGETTNRPDFKELSPAIYKDPLLDRFIKGNPNLIPAYLTNYDVRWDWYFDQGEFVSLGAFYKEFTDPIETVILPGAAQITSFDNAKTAENLGLEFEWYFTLDYLGRWWGERDWWGNWYVNTNYAWIDSTIELSERNSAVQTSDSRPLQGQSPYVWNFQLGYDDLDRGINTALLFNMFGERIVDVGINGAPDVYQEPRPVLDFVYAQKFRDHWKLKLRARNLLNAEVEITQGDKTRREFTVGREYQLALEWSW